MSFLYKSPLTPILLRRPFAIAPSSRILGAELHSKSLRQTRLFRTSHANMGVHNVTSMAEYRAALAEHKGVMVDCFATWCGPCKTISPVFVKYSDNYPNVYFIKIDVDEVPDVAAELSIRAMPTFLVFKNGERISSADVVGANPQALLSAVTQLAESLDSES